MIDFSISSNTITLENKELGRKVTMWSTYKNIHVMFTLKINHAEHEIDAYTSIYNGKYLEKFVKDFLNNNLPEVVIHILLNMCNVDRVNVLLNRLMKLCNEFEPLHAAELLAYTKTVSKRVSTLKRREHELYIHRTNDYAYPSNSHAMLDTDGGYRKKRGRTVTYYNGSTRKGIIHISGTPIHLACKTEYRNGKVCYIVQGFLNNTDDYIRWLENNHIKFKKPHRLIEKYADKLTYVIKNNDGRIIFDQKSEAATKINTLLVIAQI